MKNNARNAEYTKEYNRKTVLRLLRSEPLYKAELARRMGLTRSATSLIADELLKEGVIVEAQCCETRIGRTPVPLMLKADAFYAVGVYLNRDGCTAGLVDIHSHVIAQSRLHLEGCSREEKLEPLIAAISDMIGASAIPSSKIVGIGISAPGPLDHKNGRILNPPRFDLWHDTNLGLILKHRLGLPISLENNASSLACYNLAKAEANGSRDFLLLLVDSGVGSGVVSDGKIFKGAGYYTSELGHCSIDYKGRRCVCGNIGCLEAYAAIPNLLYGTKYSSWRDVIDMMDTQDEAHRLVIQEAEYLSVGIVNMSNIVSIDTVLLAGDLLYGADKFAPLLEQKVNSMTLRRNVLPITVLPSRSEPDSKLIAAADVAFDRFLLV